MYKDPDPFDAALFILSTEDWTGTAYLFGGDDYNGIDCSHLVWQIYAEQGLSYPYRNCATFPNLSEFFQVDAPQNGDVCIFGSSHMAIWYANPPTAGYNCYSATSSGGVRWGPESWFGGNPTYYRRKADQP